jgi:hypothetical protein
MTILEHIGFAVGITRITARAAARVLPTQGIELGKAWLAKRAMNTMISVGARVPNRVEAWWRREFPGTYAHVDDAWQLFLHEQMRRAGFDPSSSWDEDSVARFFQEPTIRDVAEKLAWAIASEVMLEGLSMVGRTLNTAPARPGDHVAVMLGFAALFAQHDASGQDGFERLLADLRRPEADVLDTVDAWVKATEVQRTLCGRCGASIPPRPFPCPHCDYAR